MPLFVSEEETITSSVPREGLDNKMVLVPEAGFGAPSLPSALPSKAAGTAASRPYNAEPLEQCDPCPICRTATVKRASGPTLPQRQFLQVGQCQKPYPKTGTMLRNLQQFRPRQLWSPYVCRPQLPFRSSRETAASRLRQDRAQPRNSIRMPSKQPGSCGRVGARSS